MLVGFVSGQCSDPEIKPITHEKRSTGSGSVARVYQVTGGAFTTIQNVPTQAK